MHSGDKTELKNAAAVQKTRKDFPWLTIEKNRTRQSHPFFLPHFVLRSSCRQPLLRASCAECIRSSFATPLNHWRLLTARMACDTSEGLSHTEL